MLIVVSGPSGAGKDVVLGRVRELLPGAFFAVTATTRSPRQGEAHGIHHYFHTREDMEDLWARGELLERAEVYGNLYGAPKAPVRAALAEGRDAIVRADVQGAASIRALAPDALLIFIAPPSLEELERRLRDRGAETEASLNVRIATARQEMRDAAWFDAVVVNETDRIEAAAQEAVRVIERERLRVPPRAAQL